MKAKKNVFIIDDSALVRRQLSQAINGMEGFQVMDSSSNPVFAAKKLKAGVPDVITLDVEMPRMDGLYFLRVLMNQHPVPVIILSSLTQKGNELAIEGLEIGACEVWTRPTFSVKTPKDSKDWNMRCKRPLGPASRKNA